MMRVIVRMIIPRIHVIVLPMSTELVWLMTYRYNFVSALFKLKHFQIIKLLFSFPSFISIVILIGFSIGLFH